MKFRSISVHPFVNGLSDHDAEIISLNNIKMYFFKFSCLKEISDSQWYYSNEFSVKLEQGIMGYSLWR